MNLKYMMLVMGIALSLSLAGCEKEGRAEKAGKKAEEAGDKVS